MNRRIFSTAHSSIDRYGSCLLSLCLHAIVVSVALLMSILKPPLAPVNLDMPTIRLTQVTIGANKEVKGGKTAEKTRSPVKPVTKPPANNKAITVPDIDKLKPTPQTEEPVKPKVPPAKGIEKTPAAADPDELLKQALADAQRTAKPLSQATQGQSLVDAALADAKVKAETEQIIGGGDGDGIGVQGLYYDSVVSRIRPHFTTRPRSDGKVFEVQITLDIADDGSITKATVVTSSGDSTFDGNVLRAIREAGKMEKPPTADQKRMTITFNSHMSDVRR